MSDNTQNDFGPIVGDVMPQEGSRTTAGAGSEASPGSPDASATPAEAVSEDQVRAVLRKVKDPDLNLNIVDLGLIYGVRVDGPKVNVDITLTSPGCPSGPEIMGNAEQQIKQLPGVEHVQMNLVWAPFWTPERIEPRVRAYLGL